METAIYWIEYVARYGDTKFMRTAAHYMPFHQYYLLDVIAFILTVIISLVFAIYILVKFCLRKAFGNNSTKNKIKKVKIN